MMNQSKTLAPEPREQQANNIVNVIFLFSIRSGKPDTDKPNYTQEFD